MSDGDSPVQDGIGAVVLAAGTSIRMGRVNKLTTEYEGKPLVCGVLDALLESGVSPVVVVTGHEANQVREAVGERPVELVHNPIYASGMGVSIVTGVRVLADRVGAMMVCVGDLPGLQPSHVQRVLESHRAQTDDRIIRPTFEGKPGHPVLFPAVFFEKLLALQGDRGARPLIDAEADRVINVEMPDGAVLLDVDTEADLQPPAPAVRLGRRPLEE